MTIEVKITNADSRETTMLYLELIRNGSWSSLVADDGTIYATGTTSRELLREAGAAAQRAGYDSVLIGTQRWDVAALVALNPGCPGSRNQGDLMNAHTPTPWTHSDFELSETNDDTVSICGGPRHEEIASVAAETVAERNANAAFIVRAVNSHAQLVAVLEVATEALFRQLHGDDSHRNLDHAALNQARAALAAAKPQQGE